MSWYRYRVSEDEELEMNAEIEACGLRIDPSSVCMAAEESALTDLDAPDYTTIWYDLRDGDVHARHWEVDEDGKPLDDEYEDEEAEYRDDPHWIGCGEWDTEILSHGLYPAGIVKFIADAVMREERNAAEAGKNLGDSYIVDKAAWESYRG